MQIRCLGPITGQSVRTAAQPPVIASCLEINKSMEFSAYHQGKSIPLKSFIHISINGRKFSEFNSCLSELSTWESTPPVCSWAGVASDALESLLDDIENQTGASNEDDT